MQTGPISANRRNADAQRVKEVLFTIWPSCKVDLPLPSISVNHYLTGGHRESWGLTFLLLWGTAEQLSNLSRETCWMENGQKGNLIGEKIIYIQLLLERLGRKWEFCCYRRVKTWNCWVLLLSQKEVFSWECFRHLCLAGIFVFAVISWQNTAGLCKEVKLFCVQIFSPKNFKIKRSRFTGLAFLKHILLHQNFKINKLLS